MSGNFDLPQIRPRPRGSRRGFRTHGIDSAHRARAERWFGRGPPPREDRRARLRIRAAGHAVGGPRTVRACALVAARGAVGAQLSRTRLRTGVAVRVRRRSIDRHDARRVHGPGRSRRARAAPRAADRSPAQRRRRRAALECAGQQRRQHAADGQRRAFLGLHGRRPVRAAGGRRGSLLQHRLLGRLPRARGYGLHRGPGLLARRAAVRLRYLAPPRDAAAGHPGRVAGAVRTPSCVHVRAVAHRRAVAGAHARADRHRVRRPAADGGCALRAAAGHRGHRVRGVPVRVPRRAGRRGSEPGTGRPRGVRGDDDRAARAARRGARPDRGAARVPRDLPAAAVPRRPRRGRGARRCPARAGCDRLAAARFAFVHTVRADAPRGDGFRRGRVAASFGSAAGGHRAARPGAAAVRSAGDRGVALPREPGRCGAARRRARPAAATERGLVAGRRPAGGGRAAVAAEGLGLRGGVRAVCASCWHCCHCVRSSTGARRSSTPRSRRRGSSRAPSWSADPRG